ncbi:hypothetical protein RWV98_07760 [Agathobaculum sp. NTUH-O15-33]|uniref:hypothetical protein n=1 Tax=Agathobaculum sp. NTUH-O15-33 TaxID=3079302 RepID=UPI002958630A|nr:hypothetical protein [Agathobaculum sp. NTUH-O15-33]WNX86157.1 hypothetical protein RWV98_07760 [Agathobaculum sp. NTUH-O15-33]
MAKGSGADYVINAASTTAKDRKIYIKKLTHGRGADQCSLYLRQRHRVTEPVAAPTRTGTPICFFSSSSSDRDALQESGLP